MVSMTTLGAAGPYTRADLDALPDDGRRHELIDGILVVTPAPSIRHQEVSLSLVLLLQQACPPAIKAALCPRRRGARGGHGDAARHPGCQAHRLHRP